MIWWLLSADAWTNNLWNSFNHHPARHATLVISTISNIIIRHTGCFRAWHTIEPYDSNRVFPPWTGCVLIPSYIKTSLNYFWLRIYTLGGVGLADVFYSTHCIESLPVLCTTVKEISHRRALYTFIHREFLSLVSNVGDLSWHRVYTFQVGCLYNIPILNY